MHRKCELVHCLLPAMAAMLLTVQVSAAKPSGLHPTALKPTDLSHQVEIVADCLSAEGCARKVSEKLRTCRAVESVELDVDSRSIMVSLKKTNPLNLGQLWHAVEQGEGVPLKLSTKEATYTLVEPEAAARPNRSLQVVIDNMDCKGCAKKIASRLYTLKGVTKVTVDMKTETLTISLRRGVTASPWRILDAVAKAKERPLKVLGAHGELAIEWKSERAENNCHQAKQTTTGGSRL